MPTISLCMITKNEEKFLEQCLNSVKDLVDEMVVVDTGSTDKTKEIAARFGAKIFDFKWCDDFSAARNESLKHATGDWILVLDADEVIAEKDHEKIRELKIKNRETVGFVLIHRNYINDSAAAGWVSSKDDSYPESKAAKGWWPVPILRLFKNIKEIRYKGAVHESVTESLQGKGKIIETEIPIHHYSKLDKAKAKEKEIYYEELGEKKVKEKRDFHSYFELGRQYVANKKFEEAIDAFEKSISLRRDYFESWFMLGSVYLLKEELDNALSKLRKAQSLNQNYSPVYANLGIIFAKKKEFQKAIKNFIKAIKLNPNDATAHKNLGMCYNESGVKKMAYLAFKKAVELNPEYGKVIKIN